MKRKVYYIISAICAIIFSACVKEKMSMVTENMNASVDLTFTTRGGDGSGPSLPNEAPLEVNENFKTLRVIITDSYGNVLRNAFEEFANGGMDKFTMRIPNLPKEKSLNFYVIGNEKSVNLNKDLSKLIPGESSLPEGFLSTTMMNDEVNNSKSFPRMRNQINEFGLPITGKAENVILSGENDNSLNIVCTHSVVKVVLNINNLMEESFWVKEVILGKFIANGGFLFPKQKITLPEGAEFREHTFTATTDGFVVDPGEKKGAFVFYMYESNVNFTDYTLALTSPTISKLKEPRLIFGEGQELKALGRNTQVNINATVDVHKDVVVTIKYEITPWTDTNVTVPPFN